MSAQIDPDREPESTADRTSPESVRLSKDDAFHLLQNARRRAVLRYLLEHDDQEQFVMRDVAEAVAAWEHDTTVQQLSSDERQRVYIALYQNHLPKLDEQGVIAYNQSRGVVEPEPAVALLDPYLEEGLDVGTNLSLEWDEDTPASGSRFDLPLLNSLLG